MLTKNPASAAADAAGTRHSAIPILSITVAVGDPEGDSCTDCLGTAAYEARVDLEGRYPGRVDVSHGGRDETQRITAAEY